MLKIEFRARRKDNGEWVEGSWLHKTRKGEVCGIVENESNEFFESYRESLQVKNNSGIWVDVDTVLNCEPYGQ